MKKNLGRLLTAITLAVTFAAATGPVAHAMTLSGPWH
jgi:hypothetical protein